MGDSRAAAGGGRLRPGGCTQRLQYQQVAGPAQEEVAEEVEEEVAGVAVEEEEVEVEEEVEDAGRKVSEAAGAIGDLLLVGCLAVGLVE